MINYSDGVKDLMWGQPYDRESILYDSLTIENVVYSSLFKLNP